MAECGSQRARRGPAPIASFDHDAPDEASPDGRPAPPPPAAPRARSQSAGAGAGALHTPAPRIDISRASSSSHHDSRDSSPELALFAGEAAAARLELGFREDGALDLRSSTEELSFLQGAPGGPAPPPAAPPAAAAARRASRRDSQGSEAALLAVSGRTSRLSSVGSQGSAHSALSRVSRLSVASHASRSPSPHKMLLETSFCGPKPIETDPELCAAAVERRLLDLPPPPLPTPAPAPASVPSPALGDARDRREVRTEATVESAPRAAPAPAPDMPDTPAAEKRHKESCNRSERRARRSPVEPEVRHSQNRSKDVIRIRLRPGASSDDEDSERAPAAKPGSLPLRDSQPASPPAPRREPEPAATAAAATTAGVSRKSSFCSLFRSRETIASPESPGAGGDTPRRKKSLPEARARSKSREREAAASAASKLRGSVLSLFKPPRRATGAPAAAPEPALTLSAAAAPALPRERLKYYSECRDGVIHIPLRTPPDELPPSTPPRPASAPAQPPRRVVLPDGSIIIPLRSPPDPAPAPRAASAGPPASPPTHHEPTPHPAPAPAPQPALAPAAAPEVEADTAPGSARRRERLVFSTQVGSAEQVFSTQLSITKTPSVASDMSASFPSLHDEPRAPPAPLPAPAQQALRDTHIGAEAEVVMEADAAPAARPDALHWAEALAPRSRSVTPRSSDSEPSSGGAAAGAAGSEAEQRGLVVQESFEEELPYVPTTLPLERSLALPMVPVRERTPLQPTAGVQRPRAAPRAGPPRAPRPPPEPEPPPAPADKLRIRLPRRPRAAPAPAPALAPSPAAAGDAWVDCEEAPERRAQPRRIQTLPGARGAAPLAFSYVEPDECRCECHAHTAPEPSA